MSDAAMSDARTARGHLLIVEDNAVNQRVATLLTERLGYTSDVVDDGAMALEAVQKNVYDAVLMDCQMPVMDGWEATERIRQFSGKARNLPIIAVTASVLPAQRDRCFSVGMNDYVPKPIDIDVLSTALERALNNEDSLARSEEPIVVESQMDSSPLRQILGDQYEEAMDSFMASARERVTEMGNSLEAQDLELLQRAAHTLKGSSRSYAMNALGDASAVLEDAASAGDRDKAASAFVRVREVLEESEKQYRASLAQPG